jgi:hypothetical protein
MDLDNRNRQHREEDLTAPPKLLRALAKLPRPRIQVPPRVDEAVLGAARQRLRPVAARPSPTPSTTPVAADVSPLPSPWAARPSPVTPTFWARMLHAAQRCGGRFWPDPRSLAPWAALATLVLLVALLARFHVFPGSSSLGRNTAEDLNGDGRVDILDAFVLARRLEQGPVANRKLDLNGDGLVDRHDVEVLATHAVRLGQGKRL